MCLIRTATILLALIPAVGLAQQTGGQTTNSFAPPPYKISAPRCVSLGDSFKIIGYLSMSGSDRISAVVNRRAVPLQIRSNNYSSVVVRIKRSSPLQPGETYSLIWHAGTNVYGQLGKITMCGAKGTQQPGSVSRERAERDEVPGPNGQPEYIVAVPSGQAQAATRALQARGATLLRQRNLRSLNRAILVFVLPRNLTEADAQGLLNGAAPGAVIDAHNIYEFAQAPRLYAASMIRDDTSRVCQLRRAVKVGVIDGPVNAAHPALARARVTRFSALAKGERRISANHGTAVAALIAGSPQSGPLAGFASGAHIYAAEAFSASSRSPGANVENIAVSMDWLVGQNVRLVNMSFAGDPNVTLRSVLEAAAQRGTVMIAASGNDGRALGAYPAAAPEVIAVTAVDAAGRLYRKANRGAHIEFSAPGVDVYAAKGTGGGYQTGTSFASPIVTAIAARLAARGTRSTSAIRDALRGNAVDLGATGRDSKFGWGLIQAKGC
ncbi:S8 family serine peptidase [Halovulum sp. GXIMD14793]